MFVCIRVTIYIKIKFFEKKNIYYTFRPVVLNQKKFMEIFCVQTYDYIQEYLVEHKRKLSWRTMASLNKSWWHIQPDNHSKISTQSKAKHSIWKWHLYIEESYIYNWQKWTFHWVFPNVHRFTVKKIMQLRKIDTLLSMMYM